MAETRTAKQKRERASERPTAHALIKNSNLRMVNGRVVTKTLADADMAEKVKKASSQMFPDRAGFIAEMSRRGVLTPTGKLTKRFGG